jgi:hypothetical protein
MPPESTYVISLEEILWGSFLMAITMFVHGFGMVIVLRVSHGLKRRVAEKENLMVGLLPVVLATCMILLVHLTEVMVWSAFFLWKGSFVNQSLAFYFSLNEYTTLGSNFHLPLRWRLLEGMIATAGLIAFAWSTAVLITLAQQFQNQQMEMFQRRHLKKNNKS